MFEGKLVYIKPLLLTAEKHREIEKVLLTESAEKVYEFIGKSFSVMEKSYKNIYYREDCFEYLTSIGIKPRIAIKIAEEIRKGIWRVKDSKYKKRVPAEFVTWAEGVKYLVGREVICEDFMPIDALPGYMGE